MYIEELKISDLKEFTELNGFEYVDCEMHDKTIVLKCASKKYPNIQPEFHLTDFETKTNYNYTFVKRPIRDNWRKFLFSKFGNKYKYAFRKYQRDKIDEYRQAIEKEIEVLDD